MEMLGTMEPILTSTKAVLGGNYRVGNGLDESKSESKAKVRKWSLQFFKFFFES